MGRTVRELEAILTPGEIQEYKVYYNRKSARQENARKAQKMRSRKGR